MTFKFAPEIGNIVIVETSEMFIEATVVARVCHKGETAEDIELSNGAVMRKKFKSYKRWCYWESKKIFVEGFLSEPALLKVKRSKSVQIKLN